MKKILLPFVLIIGLIGCKSSSYTTANSNRNQPCKVLKKELQGTYTGDCKKGLANGNGKAVGTDTYQGHFKKGLPDGVGTYTWASGAQYKGEWRKGKQNGKGSYTLTHNDSSIVKNGYWENGKYIGKNKPKPPYVINNKRNIDNIRIIKMSDRGNQIRLRFTQNGGDAKSLVTNLLLNGSSGSTNNSLLNDFVGFENINFPFEGVLNYNIPNSFKTNNYECHLKFVINNPGSWEIILDN